MSIFEWEEKVIVKLFVNQIVVGCLLVILAVSVIGCGGSGSSTPEEKRDEPVPAEAAETTSDINKK